MRRYFITAVTVLVLCAALSCCDRGEDEPEGPKLVWRTETIDSGFEGRYHSAAIDEWDYLHVVYSDTLNDRLMYAHMTAVDWDIQSLGENVYDGDFSMALDNRNRPGVVYRRTDPPGLVYAFCDNGTWQSEAVSEGGFPKYCSLAMDRQGRPHLAYSSREEDWEENWAEDWGYVKVIDRFLYAVRDEGFWKKTEIDELGDSCTNKKNFWVDTGGNAHILAEPDARGPLIYAKKTGDVWIIQKIDELDMSQGDYVLAVDSAGTPHISYFQDNSYTIRYATLNNNEWVFEYIEVPNHVRKAIAIVVDSNLSPHMTYTSGDKFGALVAVRYMIKVNDRWTAETVAYTKLEDYADISLHLDSEEKPHIVFYDERRRELKHAWLSPAGRQIASGCL
ncbi:MAG: hypothetical protein GY771_04675 [bacterium]|nr:hypothetical protein [bacterium]